VPIALSRGPIRDPWALLRGPDGHVLCRFADDVRCHALPAHFDPGQQAQIHVSESGDRALVSLRDGRIFGLTSDGRLLSVPGDLHGGFVDASGRGSFLTRLEPTAAAAPTPFAVTQLGPAGEERRFSTAAHVYRFHPPQMFWEHVAWLDEAEAARDDATQLRVQTLEQRGMRDPIAVTLPLVVDQVTACRAGREVVFVATSLASHEVRKAGFTFLSDGQLSPPQLGEVSLFEFMLTCAPGVARATWLEVVPGEAPGRRAHQLRCSRGGCERRSGALPDDGADPVVAGIGEEVLLVLADRSRTRLRLAPIAELARAPEFGPPVPPVGAAVLARHVWAVDDSAVLLVRTTTGTDVFRISPDRSVRRLPAAATPAP
jgi:hypothetical protein